MTRQPPAPTKGDTMSDVNQPTADDLWVQLKQAERDLASRASLYEAGVCSEDQFRERVQIYRAARAAYLERSTGVDLA